MRHGVLWTLVLLGLPHIAAADDVTAAAVPPVLAGSELAIERAETPGNALSPGLDLRIDDAMSAAFPPIVPGGALALEHAETPREAVPLDLDPGTNPTQLPASPDGAGAIGDDQAGRYAEPSVADRGLSFGFEVKPRNSIGALARQHEAETPGLEGQLERLIERPSFGLRGRYRF